MPAVSRGNPAVIGEMNRNLVLNLIRNRMPISRKEIAHISGLSTAAVSKITGVLLERGLIHEVGEQIQENAGRRSILLRLNPTAGFVIGVKITERAISSVVTDLEASIRHSELKDIAHVALRPAPGQPINPVLLLDHVVQSIDSTISRCGIDLTQLMGIGIGINGLVDSKAGISVMAPHFGWRDVPISQIIRQHFDIPVVVENDIRTLTIAEQSFGHGRGIEHFVTVALGFGVGAGFVVNGQIDRGAGGGAGEFGHIIVQSGGPVCSCGRRGCLEAFTSEPAIVRQVKEWMAAGRPTTLTTIGSLEQIVNAANEGDSLCQDVLAEAGRWLGVGVSSLINILNPELIIIAGESVSAGHWLLDPMQQTIRDLSFAGMGANLKIAIEQSGTETWARGAACVVLSHLFASPLEGETNQAVQRLGTW